MTRVSMEICGVGLTIVCILLLANWCELVLLSLCETSVPEMALLVVLDYQS